MLECVDADHPPTGSWVERGQVDPGYSGSRTGVGYAMRLLTARADAHLLDPESWVKSATPVLVSDPAVGQYGLGHNSFTRSADGETVLVFHSRTYTGFAGDPLFDPSRHVYAQIRPFADDGTPRWGNPLPGTRPVPQPTAVLSVSGEAR